MFTEYLQFQSLSAMQKRLSKTQNAQKNKELEKVIKSGLVDLDKRIKNISDNEKKIEKPIEIVDAVVAILDCNEQNQEGQGLKNINSTTNAYQATNFFSSIKSRK